jgi:hypothetical protein
MPIANVSLTDTFQLWITKTNQAINQLNSNTLASFSFTDAVTTARTVTGAGGLTGGGNLSSNLIISIATGGVTGNLIAAGTITGNLIANGTVGGTQIAVGSLTGNLLADNTVTDIDLRQSVAMSVMGRAANSTGNVADISATANGQVLMVQNNQLVFTQTFAPRYVTNVSQSSANNIVLNPNVWASGAVAGVGYMFVAPNTSTGNVTINVPVFGTVSLNTQNGAAMTANTGITANTLYYVVAVSNTEFRLVGSGSSGGGGSTIAAATFATGEYNATGGENSVTVSEGVTIAGTVAFFKNSIRQQPVIDYTANGTTVLALTTPAANGDNYWWVHIGSTVGVASNSSTATLTVGSYTAAGGEGTLQMAENVFASGSLTVYRNNVRLIPGSDYTANGSTVLTLIPAAVANDDFWWIHTGATLTFGTVGANTVNSTAIVQYTITGDRLANGTITGQQITAYSLPGIDLANNTITAQQLANNTITAQQLANNTITAQQLANNTITAQQIANASITAVLLAPGVGGDDRATRRARNFAALNQT